MDCYRIKHVPSGMYFMPSREIKTTYIEEDGQRVSRYVKSNLGKKGKIYHSMPSLKWLGDIYYTHLIEDYRDFEDPRQPYFGSRRDQPIRDVDWNEWTIERV